MDRPVTVQSQQRTSYIFTSKCVSAKSHSELATDHIAAVNICEAPMKNEDEFSLSSKVDEDEACL